MKRIIVSVLVLMAGLPLLIQEEPVDPNCKTGEVAICIQSCVSTLLYCGPFGTFDNGVFSITPFRDCNQTECLWNCICVKMIEESY